MSGFFALILLGITLGLAIPIFVLFFECFLAIFPNSSIQSISDQSKPRVKILIPAHNEEVGILATIEPLLPQLKSEDQIVVIADNCSDKTAEIARQTGVTVLERQNAEQRGKGYALDFGLKYIAADPPDVVVMVDADCRVEPGTIEKIAQEAATTRRPVQALYLMESPQRPTPKDSISALAFLVKNQVRPQGLKRLNFPCSLTGTGMAFPWAALGQVNLASGNIVEDMQLGVDLAIAGYPPLYSPQGQVTGILPQQEQAATKQRTRWEHGHLQTILTQVPRLLSASLQHRRLDLFVMALDLFVPPLSLLVMLWLVVTILATVAGIFGLSWQPAFLGAIEGGLIFVSILAAWARYGRERISGWTLLSVPFYILWKIPLYFGFLFKREKEWVRTERDEKKKMKIAYLLNLYPKVSHSFIRREILALEASGIEILRFAVRSLEDQVVDEADQEEYAKTRYILKIGALRLFLNVVRVKITRPLRFFSALKLAVKVGYKSERGIPYHIMYLVEACTVLRWAIKSKVDHIHVHFGTNPATVAMLCQALGGPSFSFTVHGPEEFDKPQAIGITEKINRSRFVVAISSFGRSQLYRWCDYKQWSKIHVVHCGVDHLFLNQPHVPIPEEPRFVCVGRLSEQKGHLLLVEAVSQLAAQDVKFKLIFVGDGELRDRIETLMSQLHLDDYIEITGWATNTQVRQHILDAQVLVLPSFAEGLPVVLMEALALGRPAIATSIAGVPELVEPNKSGWLVPSGSAEVIAQAMKDALHTPHEQIEQMGEYGSKRVNEQHNITIEATKLAKLFDQVTQ